MVWSAMFGSRANGPVLAALIFGIFIPPISVAEPNEAIAFDVARYEELQERDRETLEFVLGAMREAVFYAARVAQGGYEPVAEILFNELLIDGFFLEFDDWRSGDFTPAPLRAEGKKGGAWGHELEAT